MGSSLLRRLVAVGLVVLALAYAPTPAPAYFATAHVQHAIGASASSAGPTRAFGSNTTAGNAIVGAVDWQSVTVTLTSVTGCGNTYTLRNNPTTNSTIASRSAMFYAENIAGGACTLTFNFSGAVTSAQVFHEVSGVATSSALDGSASQAQDAPGTGSNAVTSTAITTTAAGDYIFGFASEFSTGSAVNVGTGFTISATANNSVSGFMTGEYQIQGAAASIAATFTIPGDGYTLAGVLALKAAGGGGASPVPRLLLLGVGGKPVQP